MLQCKLLDLKSDTFLSGPLKNPLEVGYLQLYLLDFTSNNFMQQHATEIAMLPEWHYHGLALDTSERLVILAFHQPHRIIWRC